MLYHLKDYRERFDPFFKRHVIDLPGAETMLVVFAEQYDGDPEALRKRLLRTIVGTRYTNVRVVTHATKFLRVWPSH